MTFEFSSPEKEQISLELPDANLAVSQFTEYSFESNYLEPSDRWSFTIGAEKVLPELRAALVPGATVSLRLNGLVQASGYVDSIEKSASRSGGLEWRIEGRDRLAQAVDACADPTQSLKESMTLLEGLKTLFGPFGWSQDAQFVESNEANLQLKTGVTRRRKSKTSEAKGFGRRAIRAYKLHQYRPYASEGVFQFASRISERFGLWIRTSADGKLLIIAEPDFDSAPYYKLFRGLEGSNILDGSVKSSLSAQPTHIVADSYSHAGEFGSGQNKAVYANVAVRIRDQEDGYVPPEVKKYVDAGAKVLGGHTFPASSSMLAPRARVLYISDGQSQTVEHLESFARREMALKQRDSLVVNYTVEGHGQMTDEGFIPWAVDTNVVVEDEPGELSETLYVLGRTFNKSRSGGTTTNLNLIRRNTLVFSGSDK
jgi:prophage tail gpP-like protein